MDCFDFNQLQPNESQEQCGFAATALCFAAGQPGHGPRHPVQWAIEKMASWYTEFDGPDVLSNTNGMSEAQLYRLITEKGGHYQAIHPDATSIASWIHAKYPVIIAVAESSIYDVHLGKGPYTWDTSRFNHIITVTGIDHNHIFLCRDTVNQRTGSPYSYDGDRLSYLSATVFVPDWMPRPTSAIAPTPEVDVPPIIIDLHNPAVAAHFDAVGNMWKSKLTGKTIQGAILDFYCKFGNYALNGLTRFGLPLSDEMPLPGSKYKAVMQRYETVDVFFDPGHEFDIRPGAHNDTVYLGKIYQGPGIDPRIATLTTQIADLKNQLAATPPPTTDVQQRLDTAITTLSQIELLAQVKV
jgi:hypothetical protein